MKYTPILIMVATVVGEHGDILQFILYDYRSNKCETLDYIKVVDILKTGLCIGNLKLTIRDRIEPFPKECGFSRYYSFNSEGTVVNIGVTRVLISAHMSKTGEVYTYFNIKNMTYETADKSLILSSYDRCNLFANVMDTEDSGDRTMFRGYFNHKFKGSVDRSNCMNKQLCYELDRYGNLVKYDLSSEVALILNCIWVSKLGCKSAKKIILDASIYGIGHNAIQCLNCKELIIGNGLQEIEPNAIVLCKNIETLVFPESLRSLKSNTLINCGVKTVEIHGNTLIKNECISNCGELQEIILHGKCIKFQKGIKKLASSCKKLSYIVVDKDIDEESLDTLYDICGKCSIIN